MRDLRDPRELGDKLLALRDMAPPGSPLHLAADTIALHVRDYAHNPGPIEKYGDPRTIPSTMPNAVE